MRNGIFYLTYNGVYNLTNGIGTQTQLLLSGLEQLKPDLESEFGDIDLHVGCPLPDRHTWGYDHGFFRRQQNRIAALGGDVHVVPYKARDHQELWETHTWNLLSQRVCFWLQLKTRGYDRCLIICVDQPWLRTPHYMLQRWPNRWQNTQSLLVLYNTAFIRNWIAPDPAEVDWEHRGLSFARRGNSVFVGDICPSFTKHLISHFSINETNFAPYTSSILVSDPTLGRQPTSSLSPILRKYNIPCRDNLILSFGRAAPIKGFDRLIPALQAIRDRFHFVLISVPFIGDESQQQLYDRLLVQYGIKATHVKHFTRELPRALCQWPRTKMVVLPSRQETFSNIPLEVALLARHQGPVVVASKTGGFLDQIRDGETGFLFDVESRSSIRSTIDHVDRLSDERRAAVRQQAYRRVVTHYNFVHNFPATLRWFWHDASGLGEGDETSPY